ncbi:MAG: TRAP transporter small permease [Sphaerochaetaceae bacterium]
MKKIISITKTIAEKTVDWLSIILFCVIFILGLMQVVSRWIFSNPLTWSEESIQLMYVWICYLGWVIAERQGSHIRITFVVSKLPKKAQLWINVFNHLLTITFSVLMVVFGISMVKKSLGSPVTLPWLHYGWIYGIAPVVNAIIIVYEIVFLIEELMGKRPSFKLDEMEVEK